MGNHTVEKIGGTSMSRFEEVLNNIFIGQRQGTELYQRVFVVSAYSGMTNMLLEHKKTGEPGVYERFADIVAAPGPFEIWGRVKEDWGTYSLVAESVRAVAWSPNVVKPAASSVDTSLAAHVEMVVR